MAFGVPGLHEAMARLDATEEKMTQLVAGIDKVIELLEEQNEILRNK